MGSMGAREIWRNFMRIRTSWRLWNVSEPDDMYLSCRGMIFADQNILLATLGGFIETRRMLWRTRAMQVNDTVAAGRAVALYEWFKRAVDVMPQPVDNMPRGLLLQNLGRTKAIPFGNQVLNISPSLHRPSARNVYIVEIRNRAYSELDTVNTNALAYNDTRIEYITIASGYNRTSSDPTVSSGRRFIYANFHNLKIGRGITQSGTNMNAHAVFGTGTSTSGTQGSTSAPKRYTLIVESGLYGNISATHGIMSGNSSTRPSIYVNALLTVGNDYDKVKTENNGNLEVYENLNGTFGGKYYQDSAGDYIFDTTLKSGTIGTSQAEYSTGVYVGGRGYSYEVLSGLMRFTMEGGVVYNIIGGPLVDSSYQTKNAVQIYMKGGKEIW